MKQLNPEIFTEKSNFSKTTVLVILLVFVISIVYLQTLSHQLIYLDDETLVNKKFAGLALEEKFPFAFNTNYLGGHYYRPITLCSLILDSLISKYSYLSYHLTNLAIHFITSIMLLLTLLKLGYSYKISFILALLFSLNPIHLNAIGWIAGRGDLLAGLFSVLAFFFFILFINKNKILYVILVFILLILGILSKELTIVVPVIFLIFYTFEKKDLRLNKSSFSILVLIILIYGGYFLLRGVLLSEVFLDKFPFTAILKNIFILPETLAKFFIPIGVKALSKYNLFWTVVGILVFLFLVFLPLLVKKINIFKYYFGLFWFVVLMLPGMVFRTMDQDGFYYWDCRSYLPSIGLILMFGEVISAVDLSKIKTFYYSLIIIYLSALGVYSHINIRIYKNPETFWNSVKADYPGHFLPYVGLYNYYNQNKEIQKAEFQLQTAIKIHPSDNGLKQILNNFYLINNMKQKSLELLRDEIKEKLESSESILETYIGLAIDLSSWENIEELFSIFSGNENKIRTIKDIIKKYCETLKSRGFIKKAEIIENKFIK